MIGILIVTHSRLGDALIEGHVQGDLVVVLGDVTLTETAEVEGEIVAVLGRLERAEGARVGSLTVINPEGSLAIDDLTVELNDVRIRDRVVRAHLLPIELTAAPDPCELE